MDFENWLKHGLTDSPGGEFSEAKADKVIQHTRRQAKHKRSRRWIVPMRNAGIAAAGFVLAGGLIGGVLWSTQHKSAATSTKTQYPTVANNTSQNSTQVQNHTQQSTLVDTLQMYGAGQITAKQAIAWPGLQKNPRAYSTNVQVVPVPFTSGVETAKLTAPKTIAASLPPQLAAKLVAYFVQMSQTNSFYLLGPAGMTGKAEIAVDGSFEVYLHSAHASLEVDTSGPSPVAADGMATPFFQAARTAATGDALKGAGPLAHATISHPNGNTAYFAFATKGGRNVAGWNDYLPQSNGGTARMIYESDSQDWSYAPYVLHAGVNLLNNVIAPQIGKTVEQPKSATAKVNGQMITVPNENGKVLQTPKGVAWIWKPPVIVDGSTQSAWSMIPSQSYSLAFASPQKGKIAPNSIQLKQAIPAVRVIDGDNNVFYAYPRLSTITGNQWLLYTVTWAAPGMNQPYGNDLYAYDLKSGHATKITSFLNAGGMFFSVGTSGQYLVYEKSGVTGTTGNLSHSLSMVNLSTGKTTKLPTSDLIKTTGHDSVRVTVGGKTVTIPLTQG